MDGFDHDNGTRVGVNVPTPKPRGAEGTTAAAGVNTAGGPASLLAFSAVTRYWVFAVHAL